ncbi:Uu.00g145040.m01.CDS01 [Anthostomella pinea]|uniref:Uu.00g145040.m01.CDS01 n=1 Tax=Anthostomella pinea TaxID=933095 RepID=A0AAI8VRV7_9PEZI|nr:Uu.00g145040.m01.CDS01 [Anthostomella pinea]
MSTRITELATRIAVNTAKVDDYLAANSLPAPLFDIDAPVQSQIPNAELDIAAARQAVIHDAEELRQLMLGPREQLFSYRPNHLLSQLVIVRFGLASLIPIDGEATFAGLIAAAGLGEAHVRKIVRHAMTQHIFCEPRPGVVAHTAISRLLAEDADVAAWARWSADDCWLAAYYTCEAMARWPASEEPNETGFALANDTNLGMFDFLAAHPEPAARIAAGMRLYAARPDLDVRHLVDAWAWGDLPTGATVVDVGGSHGEAALALARAFPSLKLVVQDIDALTIRAADASKPADGGSRVRFMTHDFFIEQPVVGADALIPALKPGARVILNDVVVPGPGDSTAGSAAAIRSDDLNMTMLFNASDREMTGWARLFEVASLGFHFEGGRQPPGSGLWVMVAEWKGV